MAKLQHCGHCGRWFYPDPRNAGRQKVCGDPACQGKRHQKACKAWRRRNPHYDKEDRLVEALVKDSPPPGTEAVEAIDWKAAMDLVGPEVAVLVKECGKAILRHKGIEEAIARLHFALERDTIALLVADSGYGKSTVLSLFAKSLDASNHQLVTLSLTTLGPFSLISNIATSLGLKPKRFKGDTAAALLAHLRGLPRRTILVVDSCAVPGYVEF